MQHLLLQQSSFTLHTSPTCLHFCKDFRIVSTLWKGSWLRSCLIPYSSEGYEKQIDCNKKVYEATQATYGMKTIYIPLRWMVAAKIQFIAIVAIIRNTILVFSIFNLIYTLIHWSSFCLFSFPWIPNDVIKGHTDFLSIRPMTQKRLSWHIPKHYITIILFHILCISYIRYGRKALSLKKIILSF